MAGAVSGPTVRLNLGLRLAFVWLAAVALPSGFGILPYRRDVHRTLTRLSSGPFARARQIPARDD